MLGTVRSLPVRIVLQLALLCISEIIVLDEPFAHQLSLLPHGSVFKHTPGVVIVGTVQCERVVPIGAPELVLLAGYFGVMAHRDDPLKRGEVTRGTLT